MNSISHIQAQQIQTLQLIGQDSTSLRGVSDFVKSLSNTLPDLARMDAFPMTGSESLGVMTGKDSLGIFLRSLTKAIRNDTLAPIPPLIRLDSLRNVWQRTNARSHWLWLFENGGISAIAAVLGKLDGEETLSSEANTFAFALMSAAEITTSYSTREQLYTAGGMLSGTLSLHKGDTTAAIKSFLDVGLKSRSVASVTATDTLLAIAVKRKDPKLELIAQTLGYLKIGGYNGINGSLSIRKLARYKAVQSAYVSYIKSFGSAPDIMPGVLLEHPLSVKPVSLDVYLDKQFAVLYERNISVTRPPRENSGRVVVVEYNTGLSCSSCWNEDRAMNALTQRYSANEVIPLGYHGGGANIPLANLFDSTWARMNVWYPRKGASREPFRGQQASTISRASMFTANGTILNGTGWVNGIALSENKKTGTILAPGQSIYENSIERIDSLRETSPRASVKVKATRTGNNILTKVSVSDLPGKSKRLALRIVLFEDTVRVTGATMRRLYQNVVRAEAETDSLVLGIPLKPSTQSETEYVFDLELIQAQVLAPRDSSVLKNKLAAKTNPEKIHESFWEDVSKNVIAAYPNLEDWQINPNRLHIVAFVQDLDTGEILQAARVRVSGSK